MGTKDLDTGIQPTIVDTRRSALTVPEPASLLWTATHMLPRYEQLESWLELDVLLMRLGQPGFDFVIVDDTIKRRFAQSMGESDSMIIEVSDYTTSDHPAVWRLHRSSVDRLAHAELSTHLFDGDGVHPDALFTATEAATVFREWLTTGLISGVAVDPVDY